VNASSKFIAIQNKTLIGKNLSKQVDLWKICYVEKSKPSPTFLTVLDEMWEGTKFRRIERAFFLPTKGGDTEGGHEIMTGRLMAR